MNFIFISSINNIKNAIQFQLNIYSPHEVNEKMWRLNWRMKNRQSNKTCIVSLSAADEMLSSEGDFDPKCSKMTNFLTFRIAHKVGAPSPLSVGLGNKEHNCHDRYRYQFVCNEKNDIQINVITFFFFSFCQHSTYMPTCRW